MLINVPGDLLTFFFTDIEGSTRLWELYPQQMPQALLLHDACIRNAIEQHQGHVFKAGGDAFYAVFADPKAALEAARTAQHTLSDVAWPTPIPALRVRMALHCGAAEARDGDYYGPALNRVARLLTAAHGGQVLLSSAAVEQLHAQLLSGIVLRDLGEHRLKDLARPEHIYQLTGPDFPAEFPPLRSLEAFAHNLPPQLASFVGRKQEIAEVKQLLAQGGRLVTITGMGGTGKTRLSLQAGIELFERFVDGVWFVDLSPLTEASQLAQGIIKALGLRAEPGRVLDEVLQDYLRSQQLLLILDNCEHLIEACAHLVETTLRAARQVYVLSSSREPLNITGETVYRLAPLGIPTFPPLPPLEVLSQTEAVRLFVDRATAAHAQFALTPANAAAVAKICAQLDGIPLALELAAVRVKALTPEQILTRLADRFHLLTSGSRTALPRLQTLKALIDWSYDFLPAAEQALFRRLAVFVGGWTLEAAEAIGVLPTAATDPAFYNAAQVFELLYQLVNKSLVVSDGTSGEARYRFLETLRHYALEKLNATTELPALREKHFAFYSQLAAQAAPQLHSAEQLQWFARLEAEHDNLRAALEWGLTHQPAAALTLAAHLARFWYLRGYHQEGLKWLTRAQAAAPQPSWAFLAALDGLCWLNPNFAEREALCEQALALSKALQQPLYTAFALRMKGELANDQNQRSQAGPLLQDSLALFQKEGHTWGTALALYNLGWWACEQGLNQQAQVYWEEGINLFRRTGDRWGLGATLSALGNVARLQGDYLQAKRVTEESLALFQALGDKTGMVGALSFLGLVSFRLGDHLAATTVWEECLALQQEAGNVVGAAITQAYLAWVACFQGQYETALSLLETSLAVLRPINNHSLQLTIYGRTAYFQGHIAHAQAAWNESLALAQASQNRQIMAFALDGLALVAAHNNDYPQATALAQAALEASRAINEKRNISISLQTLAQLALQQGQWENARPYLQEALDVTISLHAKRSLARLLEQCAAFNALRGQARLPIARSAAQLFGAAAALRQRIGVPIHPVDQPEATRFRALAAAALPPADWQLAEQEGQHLTLEEALALVKSTLHD